MERLHKGLEIIKNNFHTSNQQRPRFFRFGQYGFIFPQLARDSNLS
jgi:hypothetical protein